MTVILEIIAMVATVVAVTGVVLNNHRRRACFLLWMASNLMSATLHLNAGMIALTVRDAIFFTLAIHGWKVWSKAKKTVAGNQ